MSLATRVIRGLGDIAEGYDAFVLDLWGCLHDGVAIYPAALDALQQLKTAGKSVVILSNAPRRAHEVAARIADMGIASDLYNQLFTSGEETWRALATGTIEAIHGRGERVYPIMARRDAAILADTGFVTVDTPQDSDFVLVTGIEDAADTVAQFETALRAAAARDLPMICANPDLLVHRGGLEEICAGAIAQRYQELGGKVVWFGKPDPAIYRRILEECRLTADRLLCVGDALRTDIAGGAGVGAATLLTVGGIHHAELVVKNHIDRARLEALCRKLGAIPDFAIAHLGW